MFAYWANTTGASVQSFTCSWEVPPAPLTDDGQTLFLFTAIEDGARDNILQPVLQWGASDAGGGSYWSVSSWYVDPTGVAIHTNPVPVEVGELLTGVIAAHSTGPGKCTYTCGFSGKPGTTLTIPEIPELIWFSATLEAYDVNDRTQYPNTPQTVFSPMQLQIVAPPLVDWCPVTPSNQLGETIEVIANGAVAAKVAIDYGPAGAAPNMGARGSSIRRVPLPSGGISRRPRIQTILGSGWVFSTLLLALCGTAVAIEWYATAKSFSAFWGAVLAEITALAVVAGIIAKGRVLGVLIDDRNRMSLARFQLLSWSLVILSAYFTMAIWDVKLNGSLPKMTQNLWFLLGITNISSVASALLLNPKRQYTQDIAQSQAVTQGAATQSVLDVRDSPSEASWTDLFFGEEASNSDTVDVSRLQQFVFTVILAFAFIGKMLDQVSNFTGGRLDMPDLDPSAIGLLGLSNIAYLAAKQTAKPPATQQ